MRVPLDRSSRRWLERKVYVLISTLVGFWVIVVFVLVYHAMKQSPKLSRPNKAHLRVSHEIQGMNLRTRMPRNETNSNISPISNQSIRQYASDATDKIKDEAQIPILPLVKNASPLLVFTFQREDYLAQTLSQILKHIPKSCTIGCPIVVSQDGYKKEVAEVIARFQNEYQGVIPIIHWQHEPAKVSGMAWEQGYKKLAIHYGWALERIFKNYATTESQDNLTPRPDRVIILEEDLMISPDFFHYFAAMIPLLEKPESNVFTISAFNDNGKEGMVKDLKRVLRSDFFPGLGWMMTRRLWEAELSVKWPKGYWDDWLREPSQRQGRHILRPEVSRTFHFGTKGGTSNNQFGGNLNKIHLNQEFTDWKFFNLLSLMEGVYDRNYFSMISSADPALSLELALESSKSKHVRLEYSSILEFAKLARALKIMDDEKSGIPRTSYRGVIEIRPYGQNILFLVPPFKALKDAFHS